MSSVDDLSLEPVYITTLDSNPVIRWSSHNYATFGLSIAGTITTGNFTIDGTTDGVVWEELPIAQSNNQLADNEIVATGTYIVGVAGYSLIRLVPTSFTGQVRITPNMSKRITPAFTIGLG